MMRRRRAAAAVTSESPEFADAYWRLESRLDALRSAAADYNHGRASIQSARHTYRDLDRCLQIALTNALGADALGARTPDGVKTWIGEGMARSRERELMLLESIDLGGEVPVL